MINFPEIKKSIYDFLYEEEGNVDRSKVIFVGSLMILTGIMLTQEAFAVHRSHSSHSSHSSGSYPGHSSHESHVSHTSHQSGSGGHDSHVSHSSAPAHNSQPVQPSTPKVPAVEEHPVFQTPQIPPDTKPIE